MYTEEVDSILELLNNKEFYIWLVSVEFELDHAVDILRYIGAEDLYEKICRLDGVNPWMKTDKRISAETISLHLRDEELAEFILLVVEESKEPPPVFISGY